MKEINYYVNGNVGVITYFVPIGSRMENNEQKGISHLLEHMLFKGTRTRTKEEISKEIEKYGAEFNAFTDYETTCYWIKVSNKYIDKVEPILEDMVFNSVLPEEELEKEKNVVIQEIKMYEDNPLYYVWELVNLALYSKKSGLKKPITGLIENVKNIDRKTLLGWYYKYNPIKIKIFDQGENSDTVNLSLEYKPETINYPNKDYFIERNVQQSNIVIGGLYRLGVPSITDKYLRFLILSVFNDMSGRLFRTVRGDNNLVYSTYLHFEPFSCGTVNWGVYCGLDKKNISKAKSLILKELNKPITKEELEYAKQKLIGQIEMRYEDVLNIGKEILYSTLYGLDYKVAIRRYESIINSISLDYINFYLSNIGFDNNRTIGILSK